MSANRRSGVQEFLEGYLTETLLPETAEMMNAVLHSVPNKKLAEERILGELNSILPQELIRFYALRKEEGKHHDDICVAVEERIITALSESDDVCCFSVKTIQQLVDIGFAKLLTGKSSKLRLEWNGICYFFPFHDKAMTDFFQNSFQKWLNQASFEQLKGLVKLKKLPKKYLAVLLERAEVLLPKFSTEDLENMAKHCRSAIFLSIIREVLAGRYIDEALETDNLHLFLLSKAEVLENDEVWLHFLELLQKSSLKDIEELFVHEYFGDTGFAEPISKEKLPIGYLPTILNRYGKCLEEILPVKKDDCAWLWHCLAGCPFPAFYDQISECVLSAIFTVSPERAWEIAGKRNEEQLSFCRRIVWQRYIAWLLPKIATETDADKLLSWLFVCKKNKHRRKIKSRLKEVWRSWSFEKLGKFEPETTTGETENLRKTILRKKLPEYLQLARGLDDLAWAYGLCGIQEYQRKLWISVTEEILWKMPVRILLSWYKIKQDDWNSWEHQDGYHFAGNDVIWELISQRLSFYAENSINSNLGIMELHRRMEKIPRQFGTAKGIFREEIKRKIQNITDILNLLTLGKIQQVYDRFFELLPEALRDFPTEEIEKLWEFYSEKYTQKRFLEIAVAVCDGEWDFEANLLKGELAHREDEVPF